MDILTHVDDFVRGALSNGLFHGNGSYTWTDGRTYKGEWALGRPHGQVQCNKVSWRRTESLADCRVLIPGWTATATWVTGPTAPSRAGEPPTGTTGTCMRETTLRASWTAKAFISSGATVPSSFANQRRGASTGGKSSGRTEPLNWGDFCDGRSKVRDKDDRKGGSHEAIQDVTK